MSLSYRNQSIDLLCKSMDWLLYDKGLRHERVKGLCLGNNATKLFYPIGFTYFGRSVSSALFGLTFPINIFNNLIRKIIFSTTAITLFKKLCPFRHTTLFQRRYGVASLKRHRVDGDLMIYCCNLASLFSTN